MEDSKVAPGQAVFELKSQISERSSSCCLGQAKTLFNIPSQLENSKQLDYGEMLWSLD